MGRACLLAACGWDACKLSDMVLGGGTPQTLASLPPGACEMQQSVLGCSMCGARAGLWTFAQHPGSAPSTPPGTCCSEWLICLIIVRCWHAAGFCTPKIARRQADRTTASDTCFGPQACAHCANTCQPTYPPSSHTIIYTYCPYQTYVLRDC